MASWTDKQLPSFVPYIPQIPVDAYVNVGIEKQRRYEEGVQKIQSQLDNVAGLDVIRDVDKQYLQGKLDQMGNRLKIVAAGDFSNFQLTNSVGGMVGQIAKDPNIINSVNATSKFRKEQLMGETLKKEGKSSANREYDFNREVNDWFNSPEVGKQFTGQYKEHIDVNKKVLDIIGKLHPNSNIYDIPFAVNGDGSPNYKVIADAMQRRGETEVTEGQIKTAVSAMLDADDIDELASQGRFIYRNHGVADLQSEAKRNHQLSKLSAQEKLDKLQRQLLVTTDVERQATINESINYYKSLIGDPKTSTPSVLDQTYELVLQNAYNNLDEARASLYTRNWLNEIGNGFAYREIKDEVLTNPFKDNFWKQKNYELDLIKERHLQEYRGKQLDLEERKLEAEENKNASSTSYFKKKGNVATNTLTSLQDFTNHNDKLKNENTKILQEIADRSSTPFTKVMPSDVLMNIEKYKSNKYTPKNDKEKERFDAYIKNSNFLDNQKKLYETYENQAYKEIQGGLTKQQLLNEKLKDKADLTITDGGITYHFTPKEVYDFVSKEGSFFALSDPFSVGGEVLMFRGPENLSKNEQVLYNTVSWRYGDTRKKRDVKIDDYLNSFSPIVSSMRDTDKEVLKKVADKMAPITGEFSAEQSSIPFKNEEARKNFIGDLTNIAQADLGEKSGAYKYNPEVTLKKLKKNEGADVEFQFVRQGGENFVQVTDKKDPNAVELMPVDQDFVTKNPNLGTGFLNQNLDLADVMLRNNNSTNIFQDYDHAYYNSGKFGAYDLKTGKRTVTLPIACDLERDGGQVYAIFKIKKGVDDFIKLNFPLPIDYSRFENEYLPSLTDEKIVELFNAFSGSKQLISE